MTSVPAPGPLDELLRRVVVPAPFAAAAAAEHLGQLAKPPGSLGRLESLGIQLAVISGSCPPPVPATPVLVVAAGDHGVHAQGVTQWPQAITQLMVRTMAEERAAASVLAEVVGARVAVLDVGVADEGPPPPGVRRVRIVEAGTRDLSVTMAMSHQEATTGVLAGAALAEELVDAGADMLLTGDLGIANTTPSACLVAAFTGAPPAEVTGPGAANDDATVARKVAVIERALARHGADRDPLTVLASLGGAEHAALVGVILAGAARRVPVVLDGVIACAAALAATALCPAVSGYLVAGHRSTEPGATRALRMLQLEPLLELQLRLGEGTGALLAVPLVRSAAAVLNGMATLGDLGVP